MKKQSKPKARSWIGCGVYSTSAAGRLLSIDTEKVVQWALGRSWTSRGVYRELKPALLKNVESLAGEPTLTFEDLIELLFVKGFRERNISLQHIRRAAEKAARLWDTEHPFSVKQFETDGRKIFATVAEEASSAAAPEHRFELVSDQVVISTVIEQYLTQLDYDLDSGNALRWWPMGKDGRVVIDPRVRFGQPSVRGVPTETLAAAFTANEEDAERVAMLYGVAAADVRAAAEYESTLSVRDAA